MRDRFPRLELPRGPQRIFRAGLMLLLALILANCKIRRQGLAWDTSVSQNLVCPGDTVSLCWDTKEKRVDCLSGCGLFGCDACPDPTQVTISTDPDGVFPTSKTYEQSGCYMVSVSEDTTFHFRATDDDEELAPYDKEVRVILPEREVTVPGTFEGVCGATTHGWTELTYPANIVKSESVKIKQICNTNPFPIRLTLDSTETRDLQPDGCISPGRNVQHISGNPLDPSLIFGAACTPVRQNPPQGFGVEVTLTCDEC